MNRPYGLALAGALLLTLAWGGLHAATPGTAAYTYDDIGRLVAVVYDNGSGNVYSYDDAGNRKTSFAGNPAVFSMSTAAVTEGTAATITVTRTGSPTATATVNYHTVDGTATSGDYTAVPAGTPGTLTFLTTDTTKTISIPTATDSIYESTENFKVVLDTPSANAAIGASQITITLNDGTAPPSFAINSPTTVAEFGTITFTVTKTGSSVLSHNVSFATASGTAVQGTDFNGNSGNLTFSPADVTKTFGVVTLSDALYELTENLSSTLSAPTNGAVLGTSTGIGTISNTTVAPAFSVNSPAAVVEGQNVSFTVTRTGGSARNHNVTYATADGTAIAGTNYTTKTGTLNFVASSGNATQTVTVATRNDGVAAATKAFTLSLSAPTSGATIATASGTGSILDAAVPPPGPPDWTVPGLHPNSTGNYTISWTAPTSGTTPTYYELYEDSSLQYSGPNLSFSYSNKPTGDYSYGAKACSASGCSSMTTGWEEYVCRGMDTC